eukprot:SAG31_NODE_1577_length_7836_cov_3.212744_12_plen_44_part_00
MYPVPDPDQDPPIQGTSEGKTVFVDLHARTMQVSIVVALFEIR